MDYDKLKELISETFNVTVDLMEINYKIDGRSIRLYLLKNYERVIIDLECLKSIYDVIPRLEKILIKNT